MEGFLHFRQAISRLDNAHCVVQRSISSYNSLLYAPLNVTEKYRDTNARRYTLGEPSTIAYHVLARHLSGAYLLRSFGDILQ
jgi:hypothetical protein